MIASSVEGEKVKQAAVKLGCLTLTSPFSYLGTKVGGAMSLVQAWKKVVDKVKYRLSKWKIKALSIGGRLTLLESVLGSIPIYHMSIFRVPSKVLQAMESLRGHFFNGHEIGSHKASWVKWNNVLAAKDKGGLGNVIKAIHGVDGNVDKGNKFVGRSCWSSIVNEVRLLKGRGVNIFDLMKLRLVSSIRMKLDELRLPRVSDKTRWVKYVPIKVNVFAWKVMVDALPTRFNLSRIGIGIQSISCPICDYGVESTEHLFFRCSLIRQLGRKVSKWWNIPSVEVDSYEEWKVWILSLRHVAKM
nr:RNA-directed DNA polymerase, eukaryota [Tanacetum cinerariifolium]